MKTYKANVIFGGNLIIPIKAETEEEAYNKINKLSRNDFIKLYKKYGQLIDLAVYGGGDEITVDGLVEGDGVTAGSIIVVDGKNYLVTSTSKNESNTAFQTASVNARYAPSCEYWPRSLISGGYQADASGVVTGTVNSDVVSNG